MDKVKVEAASMLKVNLGLTPTIKLESTSKLNVKLKSKADLRLIFKPLHKPVPRMTRVKLPPDARTQSPLMFGWQTRFAIPSTTVVTSHSLVSHRIWINARGRNKTNQAASSSSPLHTWHA
ncbi:hypothetical protein B5807_03623 [Epicoccum nigrum]|uniref:Uncharacterized protein n=1 Tax=Epicoccum nigrum TaxID=105696 RepID=A0A1Y2M6Q6_EPING|nr:hypothetical protein B5807_03623 [Epicoccum nigrum]